MKQEFIDFLNALMEAAPNVVKEKMTDNIQAYIDTLTEDVKNKPALTDNGKQVLIYMREHPEVLTFKARTIAEGLFMNPRGVSGSMRKLTNDGFVEKLGESPAIYSLTEKGQNFIID